MSSEEKILAAALKVFIEKGYDGARMQEIASVAGINKALLHYYFRSKENLYMAVFESAINSLLPPMAQMFSSDKPLDDKIREFFDIHMAFLISNPDLLRFVISELTRHSDMLKVFIDKMSALNVYKKIESLLNEQIEAGEIKQIEPIQLLLNILSLSVFPILASPMIKGILNLDNKEYNKILEERKVLAAEFVINSIKA